MITEETTSTPSTTLLESITDRAFAHAMAMIYVANHR